MMGRFFAIVPFPLLLTFYYFCTQINIAMRASKYIYTLILLLVTHIVAAQRVKLLSSEGGLSNSLINDVCQDSYGYIWIATEDGLNRYDGQNMTVFRSSDGHSKLLDSYVHSVFEDHSGTMWAGGLMGLQYFDRQTNTFVEVPMISNDIAISAHVTSIVEDNMHTVWAATSGRGLMRVEKGVAKQCMRFPGIGAIEYISSILVDSQGYLWIVAHKNGIYRCNIESNEVTPITIADDHVLAENATVEECNNRIYLNLYDEGLFVYNHENERFEESGFAPEGLEDVAVTCVCTQGDCILVGTDGNGLFSFDPLEKTTRRVGYFVPQIDFNKAKVHTMMEDRDGNLWLGLFQRGVMMTPRSSDHFLLYGYKPGEPYNIGSGCVMALKAVKDGLWISIDSDGLYYVDAEGNSEHVTSDLPQTIMDIKQAPGGGLWLAGYSSGLIRYDVNTKKVENYNHMLSAAMPDYNKRTVSLAVDNKQQLWVGTYGCGVFRMTEEGEVKSFMSSSQTVDYERNEPVNNWINTICADGENVWMGTYCGICCYNTERDRFVTIDKELYAAVGSKVVFGICRSNDGLLWVGTNSGLVQYDPQSRTSYTYDASNGLAGVVVSSVKADKNGMVWVGTYGGLSRVDPASRQVDNYYAQDGLQGNEFSRGAVDADYRGNLYFGGLGGVSRFDPYKLMVDKKRLKVAITKFFINGGEVSLETRSDGYQVIEKSVVESSEFTFSCAEKSISFELSTFNFINPDQVTYEYSLSGFDNAWHTVSNGGTQVSFTNLPHGHYRLNVRAKLGNNFSDLKVVKINIMPMWWQTGWAYAGYIVLIGLVVWAFLRSYKSRKKIKEELMKREHERSIDEAKFQFFFNISHEIRTPLTLIINPIRELMSDENVTEEQQRNYNLIFRNSMRILRLINQLLDIRKIEQGQVQLHFRREGLKNFVQQIDLSFTTMAEKKGITSTIECLMDNDMVDIDVNNFDKVIYNVYSNAYKFTPDGGEIKTTLWAEDDKVHIDVADTGIGIEPDQTERIFDRFYQVENSQSADYVGTGIGLHLTRSVVEMHGGTITAQNRVDSQGTLISIIIPRRQKNAVVENQEAEVSEDQSIVSTTMAEGNNDNSEPKYHPSSNKKVLVVDDEAEVNNYLMSKLSKTYKVTTCNNGREAYELLLKEPFDMVISDVMMPEMDGFTLCRKLKMNININHIPIILLTAKHSEDDRNQGILTGADAYIAKPFDIEHLRNTVAGIIANRERILSHTMANYSPDQPVFKKITIKSSDELLLEKVTTYIDENISDPLLNVEKLAYHVGMSRVHMHRKLKELTNQSARDYIRNIRLKQAGILLGEKKLNISEVAYALGFANLSHFSSSFKDFYGMSPKEYMNGHLSKAEDQAEETEEPTE